MGIKEDWRREWATKQAEESIHPLSFWMEMTEMLFENRRFMQLDWFQPLGHYLNNWDAFGLMVKINNVGMQMEENKGMQEAFVIYEVCVAEAFGGSHPYDRLRIWYTKNKDYRDAMRVCRAYLELPEQNGLDKEHFRHHLGRLQEKLDRQKGQA